MAVTIEGLAELKRKLDGKNVITPAKETIRNLSFKLEAHIKRATVWKTGRLHTSINTRFFNNGESAEIGTNVEYAPFIETGTKSMQSRHMMGALKVLGEGGSFSYGIRTIEPLLTEAEKQLAEGIEVRIDQ